MYKKICFITNPAFGKSKIDDEYSVEQMNNLIEVCKENNCKDIVICGGLYSLSRCQVQKPRIVEEIIDEVVKILPTNLDIRYKVLSGATEAYVLKRNLVNMNKELSKKREDVEHLGFDRVIYKDYLIKCNYNKQNNIGYNDGEILNYKGHVYDPSIRLNNIIKDYNGEFVLIGGRNRFEEFVYNNKIVIALPSLVNPCNTSYSPDLGYVIIEKDGDNFDVKQHVKVLNMNPLSK